MKTNWLWPLSTLALAAVLVLGAKEHDEHDDEHVELATPMGHMQRFADKLYFAGINSNWELADFYLHEIEEQAGEIAEAGIVEDGIAITPLIKTLLEPAVENMEKSTEQKSVEEFRKSYTAMVQNCNACHAATEHGFIRIIVPDQPSIRNQDYKPAGK